MALPGSGQLSLSAIRDEFGAGTTSNVSLRTLSAAAGLSVPDGLNEFYGLSAFTPPQYISGATTVTGAGTAASPYNIYDATITNFNPSSTGGSYEGGEFGDRYEVYRSTSNAGNITFRSQADGAYKVYFKLTGATINGSFCAGFSGDESNEVRNCYIPYDYNVEPTTRFTATISGPGIFAGSYSSSNSSQNAYQRIVNVLYTDTTTSFPAGSDVNISHSSSSCYYIDDRNCVGWFICGFGHSVSNVSYQLWFEPN